MKLLKNVQKSSLIKARKFNGFLVRNQKTILVVAIMVGASSMYGQTNDNLTEGLEGISTDFETKWWPSIKTIAYILAGVFALFGLVNVFKQSQRGEDNVGKVAGAWIGGLAVFLLGIWSVDTFIIGAI
jgi:uncharacterized membrane protein YiaA